MSHHKLTGISNGVKFSRLPKHIAIIMDGNGRWAKRRKLPRIFGHRKGVKTVKQIVETCVQIGVEALTLYAFSTENWVRPRSEISALMLLLKQYVKSELPVLMKNNVRLRTIGEINKFPAPVRSALEEAIKRTERNTGMVLNLALNYGARQEILRVVNKLLKDGVQTVDELTFEKYLDTAGLPEPDLFIRTSGEIRLSNYLLWQLAYSELYFTDVLWPDFSPQHLYEAINEYGKRDRRFGGL